MKGFTLVETMVTLVIFSFMVASIFAVLEVANQSWNTQEGTVELQQGLRQAMEGMVREARQVNADQINVIAPGTRVDFNLVGVTGQISYYLLGNQIIREHPIGTTRVVANNISALNFCCVGGAGCLDCDNASELQIQSAANEIVKNRVLNFSLLERVKFRN